MYETKIAFNCLNAYSLNFFSDKFSEELKDQFKKLSDGKCYSRIGKVRLLQIIWGEYLEYLLLKGYFLLEETFVKFI